MGRLFVVTLQGKIYRCKHCNTHLALYEDIVSKSFHCRHGKAYLFSKVTNVTVGEKEERVMTTGLHTVADIFCVGCGSIVGWKYVFIFRRLRMKTKSTKKENQSLSGLRF
ncbi:protein yippee-like isoform X2 [Diospyros lotus]|uniref:protein yippee-like isoform X2 n=1 Tax=Diospyros lotus TaxID=55363 RepID=UPI0022552E7A|nr:protein yippee-like isoform X2 [Diospyros lotus]